MSAMCREPPPFYEKTQRRSRQPRHFGDRPHPPAPRRPAGLPSVTPQDRRRRLRLDADRGALVDGGAVRDDVADDVLGW
jgi:hypothetical protein